MQPIFTQPCRRYCAQQGIDLHFQPASSTSNSSINPDSGGKLVEHECLATQKEKSLPFSEKDLQSSAGLYTSKIFSSHLGSWLRMVSFEQYTTYQPEFLLDQDEIKQEPFEMSYSTFDSLPSVDNMFASHHDYKYEMLRSASQESYYHTYADAAPSLLSSNSVPSLPSASSSTIGSPHSGYAQPVSNGFMYSHQFGAQPAIMCDDGYSYGYQSANFDHEAAAEHKFAIGECQASSSENED